MGLSLLTWTNLCHGFAWCAGICVLCLLIAPAFATPTSLNVIPTADVLPNGTASLEVQLSGGPTEDGYLWLNEFQTQLGVGGNIEFGLDPSLGPPAGTAWNAKYRLWQETRRRPALAVGLIGNLPQFSAPYYVTAFKSNGRYRAHFGVVELEHSLRGMFGFDTGQDYRFVFQADYVSGPGAYASVGVVINWPNGLSLNVAQLIGNTPSSPHMYMVVLGWSGQVL